MKEGADDLFSHECRGRGCDTKLNLINMVHRRNQWLKEKEDQIVRISMEKDYETLRGLRMEQLLAAQGFGKEAKQARGEIEGLSHDEVKERLTQRQQEKPE